MRKLYTLFVIAIITNLCLGIFSASLEAADPAPSMTGDLKKLSSTITDPPAQKLVEQLTKGLDAYLALQDYESTFYKTERAEKALGPEEVIFLKFEKPFKIFMKWRNTDKEGVQVFYERGAYDGKLLVHKPGLLFGLAPLVFLDQDSPLVREGSASYNIEDAGIGNFLAEFARCVIQAGEKNLLSVTQDSAHPEWMEVTFPDRKFPDDDYIAHRIKLRFDPVSSLPVEMQLFDARNEPTGLYRYDALVVNVGSADEAFMTEIHRALHKAYTHRRVRHRT